MVRMIGKILRCYGRTVRILREGQTVEVKAFLQSDTGRVERLTRLHPGPLGQENQNRYVYIGPAEEPLTGGTELEAAGKAYLVRTAELIYAGEEAAYVWAMCVEKGATERWGKNG